ncbi:MAG: regulatory protein TetR [Herbaspirillum sp.]|jgi:TetR/AcrR family transcriptional repressor of nem operon|nr:regulatory protein TetR [Herbaspirillum sp.]
MGRSKEFDRREALLRAIEVFSEHGYEGTSTETLLRAMGIGRQSLYDTFGDKWNLYLEAVQHYTADSIGDQIRVLNAARCPIDGLKTHLYEAAEKAIADPRPSCLGISAICEFGCTSPELNMLSKTAALTLLSALERRLSEAKADGTVAKDVDVQEAANFIKATLAGIKVAARAGASPENLRGIARMAVRALA